MTSKLVLDCESFETAVDSLTRIFQTTPDSLKALLSAKEIGTHYETHWQELPDFKDYIYSVVEQHFGSPLALDSVCWFHTTRILPGTSFAEGILPLDAALPSLKAMLIEAVDDVRVKGQLERALTSGGVANHHYANKTQNSLHWGPYGILVREVAFCANELSQHDYLGMPEIIEDICDGFEVTSGVALIDIFSAKLKPAIVKFTSVVDYAEAYVSTALCYVHSTIQEGKLDTNSVICFDGENNPVPPHDILKVEIVDLDPIQG
jgi:hypothetical protein